MFTGLDKQQIAVIVRLQAKRVAERLASRKIKLELTDSAVDYLADKGFDPVRESLDLDWCGDTWF